MANSEGSFGMLILSQGKFNTSVQCFWQMASLIFLSPIYFKIKLKSLGFSFSGLAHLTVNETYKGKSEDTHHVSNLPSNLHLPICDIYRVLITRLDTNLQ